MSQPRGFGLNGKSTYANVARLCEVFMTFTVDSAAGEGLTSLKSNGYVVAAYMNSSAPSSDNPNPAAGVLELVLTNNFNHFLGAATTLQAPLRDPELDVTSSLVPGEAYIITAVGTTTATEWQSIGLSAGVTPAVDQSFIAASAGTGGLDTGKVKRSGTSGVDGIELIGTPDTEIANRNVAANGGARLIMQFTAGGGGRETPNDGTVVSLRLTFDGSAVSIDGI